MFKALSYQIGSDSNDEAPKSLNHLAKELKSLKIWKRQEALLKEKDRMENYQYLPTLEEELRHLNKKQA